MKGLLISVAVDDWSRLEGREFLKAVVNVFENLVFTKYEVRLVRFLDEWSNSFFFCSTNVNINSRSMYLMYV